MAGTLEINARIMIPIVLFHRPAIQGNGPVPGSPDRRIPLPEYARTDASSASRLPSPRWLNPRSPFPAQPVWFFLSRSPPRFAPATFEDRRRFPRIARILASSPRRFFDAAEVSREIMEIAVIPGNQRRRRVAQTFPYARAFNNAEAHARAPCHESPPANIEIPRLFSRPRKYACTKRGPLLYHGLISP